MKRDAQRYIAKSIKNEAFKVSDRMSVRYEGFGIYDTLTGTWFSHDGHAPYVLGKKKVAAQVIAGGWSDVNPINGKRVQWLKAR